MKPTTAFYVDLHLLGAAIEMALARPAAAETV
jgi:hypothetical protein